MGNAMNAFRLDNKTVLVTGASSGLGAHFAQVLAQQGAKVLLAARRAPQLAEQVDAIRAAGGSAAALSMDITQPQSVEQAFAQIATEHGGIDVLINNAGVATEPRKFADTDEDAWQFQLQTNLSGAWRVARAATKHWIASSKPGVVVNVGSIYGLRTGVLKVAYNVSKAGVVQLTRSMAMELVRHDIRVNCLCPGWFHTAINADYFATESGARYEKSIPMGRLGRLEELDGPLLLLASDAGRYMTGAELVVDGGIVHKAI
jgi:NAD(P)-dependent dehydrogenase (short-subunit alcohol dehydrogenase family)